MSPIGNEPCVHYIIEPWVHYITLQAGLVFIPGVGVGSRSYRPLLQAMQRAAASEGISLFAGVVHYESALEFPRQPEDLRARIASLEAALRATGMQNGGPIFHAAHSLSTVFLQDHLRKMQNTAGQILIGGTLLRKHCEPAFTYNVPTLTVGAEFDGHGLSMRNLQQFHLHQGHGPN